MNGRVEAPGAFSRSVQLYQLMLRAYPRRFRQEYGADMLQVFRDCCVRALQQGGRAGMLQLWSITVFDFIGSMIEQHTHKETYMTQDKTIRGAGWALMLAGISLMLMLVSAEAAPSNWELSSGFALISAFSVAAGMLGLRAAYTGKIGSLGTGLLLAGAITTLLSLGGFVPGIYTLWADAWILAFGGPAFALAFLAAFGVVCARRGVTPTVSKLAVLSGVWFAPLMIVVTIVESTRPYEFMTLRSLLQPLAWIAFLIQNIALISLGYNLQKTTSPQPAAAT